jgi:ATP-dependent helicase/nuclease subunit A
MRGTDLELIQLTTELAVALFGAGGDILQAQRRAAEDSELAEDLLALRADVGPTMRERARRLFAKVLDAPGGLRIQTIHSFAQALLASFPDEAGIAPGFKPIEGRAEQELARTTLANLLAEAEAGHDGSLLADVQSLSLRLGEDGAVDYLMRCARVPEAMAGFGAPWAAGVEGDGGAAPGA